MKYDIIIIGAGLGGLIAGAKLSKEGKRVLLLEQHNRPGGCATNFRRGDFTLEVGLHEMDGPSPRDMKSRIFNDLDIFDNVEFIRVPEFYRFMNGRYSVTIPHDPAEATEILSGLFPGEINGIKAYFEQILNPKKKPSENDRQDKSLGEFLDSIIKNDDLKLILLGNLGYFHDDPYTLSLGYYSVAQGSYYKGGASFIKGGSQKLSDYLAGYIRSHGGEVLLNHLVTGFNAHDNKVTGVVYKKKSGSGAGSMEAHADEIIANNAIPNIAELLPAEYGMELKNEIRDIPRGASLLSVYFGFNRSLKELGHNYYSTFIYDSSVKSQADILRNNRDDFSRRSFTFVDYGQIDSGLAPAGKSVGAVCCVDYLADWEKLTRQEYDLKKQKGASEFIERLEKLIPGIKNTIEYYEAGTSASVKRYTLNPGGEVYGFAQTPSRRIIESFKSLDNLHFASAWGKTGGGFSGVIFGGYLCAVNILRKRSPQKL
ncbi:MAG: NAD(P)/FAD-dependent oxidoreductase [Bacteroidales bacterium]|jgi:phytoene dehydrogenase-like protein|nr:NAD(P)/FAD-dependent oxidoreductase [Bacteroidales bacterium]